MDGVVVVFEAEERRFARVIKVVAGADASGGRTAELLKVAASGRGVVSVVKKRSVGEGECEVVGDDLRCCCWL